MSTNHKSDREDQRKELLDAEISKNFLISEINVEQLFGHYSYRISPLTESEAQLGATPLMMLYGGNGSGKTTLLRMLWNLFSPSPNSGHRTYLRDIPFKRLEVRLGNGDVIKLDKVADLVGDLVITVTRGEEVIAEEAYRRHPSNTKWPLDEEEINRLVQELTNTSKLGTLRAAETMSQVWNRPGSSDSPDSYVSYLNTLGYTPILLADDRRMHFDTVDEATKKAIERRRKAEAEDLGPEDSQLAIQVEQAIRRTHDWLRQSVLTGAQEGSQSVDDLYRQILLQLSQAGESEGKVSQAQLRSRLLKLEKRSQRFTEFGIFSGFEAAPYLDLLQLASGDRLASMSSVIEPYLGAQDARLDKLQDLEEVLRAFVTNVNKYLTNKHVEFTLQRGLVILENESETRLRGNQLSSGERQLLLLLCNALLARSGTGLFIIDEPELSLNARWQRQIVGSLLDCVRGSNVQFVMATHSIEILTRHRRFLARLEER